MQPIPEDFKPFLMLFDGEWQRAVEVTDTGDNKRWFRGDVIGTVPMDEITDWKVMDSRVYDAKGEPFLMLCEVMHYQHPDGRSCSFRVFEGDAYLKGAHTPFKPYEKGLISEGWKKVEL